MASGRLFVLVFCKCKNSAVPSPYVIGVIKSRRIGMAGHVERMGVGRDAYRDFVGKHEGK